MNRINPNKFVKNIINKSAMNMNDWAKMVGVSRQTIYNWMRNNNTAIRKSHVNKIANISKKKIIWEDNYLIILDEKDYNKKVDKSNNQNSQLHDNLSLIDINDNLERELQLLITKYDHAYNTASDPMAVALNENYTSMNAAMEKLLGIKKRRKLFGANIYDIVAPPFRNEKKQRRTGNEAIGKFEYKTALQDIYGNTIKGKLNVTRFWLPTNKFDNILCCIMTFFPDNKM
jgi:PAS domain-containing protein|tara:strand:- start:1844 stop:2533 length:690 start_codon:yes stop_codon:yes gene_type:complete